MTPEINSYRDFEQSQQEVKEHLQAIAVLDSQIKTLEEQRTQHYKIVNVMQEAQQKFLDIQYDKRHGYKQEYELMSKLCTKWMSSGCSKKCPKFKTCPVVYNFNMCYKLQNIKQERVK